MLIIMLIDYPQTILEAILPYYLKHLKENTAREETPQALRTELSLISSVGVSIRAMIGGAEGLTRFGHNVHLRIKKFISIMLQELHRSSTATGVL